MDAATAAYIAIAVAAASEIIAISPLKANSVIQLALQFLRIVFPKK
jgi:hypothetical protein